MADISDFYGRYRGDDPIGKLMEDFRATSSTVMNYKELADGVHHFKETEKGRDLMCEAVRRYAEEYAEERVVDNKVEIIKNLMKNMKLTLEQALNAAGVTGEEKEIVIKKLQN